MKLKDAVLMYRVKRNMSMKKFAKLCNVTIQTVYNVETLGTKPSKMTAAKLKLVMGDEYPADEQEGEDDEYKA